MAAAPAAEMAQKYPGLIVGIKTAHYAGPEWAPVESAVEAGTLAEHSGHGGLRVRPARAPGAELVTKKLRPGRHLHPRVFGPARRAGRDRPREPGLFEGRKRGVIFDVGHGGGSFAWRVAVPAIKEGFVPDSISTDLHIGSMNAGMKDMLNVMSKFLAMGLSLDDVIERSTWNPAREIKQEELGHLSVGAAADVAVLRAGERQLRIRGLVRRAAAREAAARRAR